MRNVMRDVIIIIRLAIVAAVACVADHFGVTPLGVFLGLLAAVYFIVTLRMALLVE